MRWEYQQPVKIIFGDNERKNVFGLAKTLGLSKGFLVCDRVVAENGFAKELVELSGGQVTEVFTDFQPNPTVVNIDNLAAALRESGADYVIAMGGGSCIDCAKAAAAIAKTEDSITKYHATGVAVPAGGLTLLAIPTTAGTGSEVTAVSVVTNEEKGLKAPIVSEAFYPKYAIVDPVLTYTVPPKVSAATGLDVLAHAVEGFYSRNHQPICDTLAAEAAQLVFTYLERACQKETDKEAKSMMAQASLLAGMAFNLPKTGASHACSFVLTNRYHIPHGEACALTLDYFTRLCKGAENNRLEGFAQRIGFADVDAMCDRILEIKKATGSRIDLKDLNLTDGDIDTLVKESRHPNMLNAPVEITDDMLYTMYRSFR
ncbi:iron-containing alcohol dehydrogenase family protein [Oscillospiraceae bacterium MB08-C2-2]|nr:iron-containing alcohol dehydrogenase family protein [Oscillospiraceae bacterium MB08-C2-2]